MPGFWDASALVPICVPSREDSSARRSLREHPPVVWWGTSIEIVSAIARLCRRGQLTVAQHEAAYKRLEKLRSSWREVEPTERLRNMAERQLVLHDLSAADALQLAAALVWCRERPKGRSFLCRDERLREAARRAGFDLPIL